MNRRLEGLRAVHAESMGDDRWWLSRSLDGATRDRHHRKCLRSHLRSSMTFPKCDIRPGPRIRTAGPSPP